VLARLSDDEYASCMKRTMQILLAMARSNVRAALVKRNDQRAWVPAEKVHIRSELCS